jgi:hypothetical protein
MKTVFSRLLAIAGFASSSVAADVTLAEGDCWLYDTRLAEPESFLVIRKIEKDSKLSVVVHISVFSVKIRNLSAPSGFTEQIGHLPISEEALRRSLKSKAKRRIEEADWTEGYRMWREARDAGEGGVFTKTVSECVTFVDEAINRKKG